MNGRVFRCQRIKREREKMRKKMVAGDDMSLKKGLSRMMGNYHVRLLEEETGAPSFLTQLLIGIN